MDRQNEHHGFLNGLLVGAILGALIMFLLGTDKGRRLLKAISEEGLENMSGLGDMLDSNFVDDEEQEEIGANDAMPVKRESSVKKIHSNAKRFFRKKR